MLHYSQKRRYYFFITIVKFKTVLSYYPTRWRKLPPYCLSFAQPSLNLRSTFAQPSLMIAPHLRHTYATLAPHTLANFQSLPKLISCLAGASFPSLAQACSLCPIPPNAYPSSHTRLCQLADFPSSHTRLRQLADFPSLNLRSTFAQPSLNLRL